MNKKGDLVLGEDHTPYEIHDTNFYTLPDRENVLIELSLKTKYSLSSNQDQKELPHLVHILFENSQEVALYLLEIVHGILEQKKF